MTKWGMEFERWVDKFFANSSVDLKLLQKAFDSINLAESQGAVVYPISANPPTWGHADIMMRAAKKFSKLHWVAASNLDKGLKFTDQERLEMMQKYVDYYQLDNVQTAVHKGAIIRYAKEVGAVFLLRSFRSSSDFQAELELASGNRGIDKEIETICLFSKPHFATISSSIVRELVSLGENIEQYVHPDLVASITQAFGREGNLDKRKQNE